MVIAIDGPGGVGKSTVARLVGARLGLPVLDTGALYRGVTAVALERGLDPSEGALLSGLAERIDLQVVEGRVLVDGVDRTTQARSPEVTASVSAVAAHPEVRGVLVRHQRAWVDERGGSAVVEGRDIGTVVFPSAPVKVFLTARSDVRAARRALQQSWDPGRVARELAHRDRADSTREAAPLRAAEDAVVIDTSDLTAEQVADRILELVAKVG